MRRLDKGGKIIVVVIGILIFIVIWLWLSSAAKEYRRKRDESEDEPSVSEETAEVGSASWHHILFHKNRNIDEKYVVAVHKTGDLIDLKAYHFNDGVLVDDIYRTKRKFVDRGEKLFHNSKVSVGVKNNLETYFINFRDLKFASEARYKAREIGPGIYLSFFDTDPKYWGYIIYTQGDETNIARGFKRAITTDSEGEITIIDTNGGQFGYLTTYEIDQVLPIGGTTHRSVHYYV